MHESDHFTNIKSCFYSTRVFRIIWYDFPSIKNLRQVLNKAQEMRFTFHQFPVAHHHLHSTKLNAMRDNFFLDFHKMSELLCDYDSDWVSSQTTCRSFLSYYL
jgi:hypothetical protein